MGFRTIHLKLHNPGKAKQSIIETAFLNYNNAFDYLLQKAHADIDRIENDYRTKKGTYSTLALSKWVDKDLSKEINKFDIQPFKDSLKLDLGMALANYFAQKKANPDIPFPHSQGKSRPIYFCRYDTKRSFCLLHDNENNKYFVKLFLMNTKGARLRGNTSINRELTYIFKNHEPVKPLKKETFIIMPLSFGKWQEEMLKKAIDNPGILRTAHLIKKGTDYFLSLSINLPQDEKIEIKSYLGVSRGIENALNYAISDMSGNILENGAIDYENDNIYIIANKIVDLALKNTSTVVLQNLVERGDKLSWNDGSETIKPIFGCKIYNEIVRILEYKLTQKGLPEPAKVSSVDIFNSCCKCGNNTRKNRFSKTMFICTACGSSYKLDTLGSINLATKLIKYENTPLKLRALKTADGMQLQNDLIGLDLFIAKNESPFDKMKEEITAISAKESENSKDVNSIIDKLIKHDFTNIEIV